MLDLTQIEIELIVGLAIAIISLMTNAGGGPKFGDPLLGRFFAIICLLAICGLAYHAYLQSGDKVFIAIAVIAALLLLFLFLALTLERR